MNIGLFGGTFNPLHNGHIETIKYVADKFALEKVIFIPCAIPPHKTMTNLASAEDRFKMVSKALNNIPKPYKFSVSDIELQRKGPSFTIDTIREFKKIYTKSTKFFFIIGSDAFLDIQTWKNFKEIFNELCVIIMLRNQTMETKNLMEKIRSCIKTNISSDYKFNNKNNSFLHNNKKEVYIADVPNIAVSSTIIRKYIKQGVSIEQITPHEVAKQIYEKGLYL